MDGTIPIDVRQSLIDKFNKDSSISVFLLTTHVGSLGISLVGANCVIIYDIDWNPHRDIQARDRCYRFGQERAIEIYRLINQRTIEEMIYYRQIYKLYLSDNILSRKKMKINQLDKHYLEELFNLCNSRNCF